MFNKAKMKDEDKMAKQSFSLIAMIAMALVFSACQSDDASTSVASLGATEEPISKVAQAL